MQSQLWRFAVLVSRILEEPAERDAVLGDLKERRVAARRALLEVAALVVRRQSAHLCSWQLWLTAAMLFLPVLAVVSPASTVGLTVFQPEAPGAGPLSQSVIRILLGGAAGTAVLAWATGFATGRLAKRRYPVILLLVILALALLLQRASGSTAGGASSFWAQAAALFLLAGIPAGHGLWVGIRNDFLSRAALAIVSLLGISAVAMLVPASALGWNDIVLLAAIWPAMFALVEHCRVGFGGSQPPRGRPA